MVPGFWIAAGMFAIGLVAEYLLLSRDRARS
jgi:hypothetical protein